MDDLEEALFAFCKIAQIELFKQGYKDLQASWELSSKSPLLPFHPVLTEGIVRVGGHLDEAPVLSPKHPLSRLLVQDLQKKHFHVGREHTLALVHRQFWIPRGKLFIRKIFNDCLHCKRRREKPDIVYIYMVYESFTNPTLHSFVTMSSTTKLGLGLPNKVTSTCMLSKLELDES